jgi:diguanylate cyclase (GGDEF)-like protein
MARKRFEPKPTGRTIVVIDDSEEYLVSTVRLLSREGHTVEGFADPRQALDRLRERSADLVLVDYFMPEMSGEQVVKELRTFDPLAQVILQTGYASEQPAREMLRQLDIQGYFDKSEGADKLLLWVDVGLRGAATVTALERSRQGLRYILSATPDLHRVQPLTELLQGVLLQTAGLLGLIDSFVAVSDSFVAIGPTRPQFHLCAGTGRFRDAGSVPSELRVALEDALTVGEVRSIAGTTLLPLRVGELSVGAIYLDRELAAPRDRELVTIFANQAAVAIHNAQLYQLAAFDPLTGAYTRRFLEHSLVREIRIAHRTAKPLSILMVDVDGMKGINDRGGHVAGDEALSKVGRALGLATRATDIVGRYGGDEFAVALPGTAAAGAEVVIDRIRTMLDGVTVGHGLPVRISIGLAVLEPTTAPASVLTADDLVAESRRLVGAADEQMYADKRLHTLGTAAVG